MLSTCGCSRPSLRMPIHAAKAKKMCRQEPPGFFLQLFLALLVAISAAASPAFKTRSDEKPLLAVRLEFPETDVMKAVQEVTQDQIIHGTYSYEKERILYGAHSANSARAFGTWPGPGKAYYKVADQILSPRYFKNSGDIGTITVRYVIQEVGPGATVLQIDAVFVDARNSRHPSEGNVESGEYGAIQSHLKTIQASRQKPVEVPTQTAAPRPQSSGQESVYPSAPPAARIPHPAPDSDSVTPVLSVEELQEEVRALRRQVELRVKDSGAPLKSAPFQSSATIVSLPPQTEVLIVVLTPYWYGVETEDGHHGWIHHSQLEPLP
jgi:hypothetical protein